MILDIFKSPAGLVESIYQGDAGSQFPLIRGVEGLY